MTNKQRLKKTKSLTNRRISVRILSKYSRKVTRKYLRPSSESFLWDVGKEALTNCETLDLGGAAWLSSWLWNKGPDLNPHGTAEGLWEFGCPVFCANGEGIRPCPLRHFVGVCHGLSSPYPPKARAVSTFSAHSLTCS
ncbi:hypothetical protein AMECASPLE_011251 [Ameca splendens]|uniref:Uncharacterized protein n=1 Tax=Ameca splendens TaxID=208324 RepID=A0ABV0XDS9_9TELE